MVVDSHPCLTYLKNKRKMEIQILCFIFFISLIILLFEIKTALSYCFIFGLSISLIVLICMYPRFLNGAERKMRSLRYTSPKYLFDLVIPNFLYNVTQLDFGCFKIENVLFNDAGICLVDSLQSIGVLHGERMQYLLEIQSAKEQQCCRKVKNPFRTLLYKRECLKLVIELYDLNSEIYSGLYLPHANWVEGRKDSSTDFLIEGGKSLKKFIKNFERSTLKVIIKNQYPLTSSEDVIYALMSIRYFGYLRQFYHSLMPLQKIRLKKELSPSSIILFEFVILKDAFTLEKLERFINKNKKQLKVGMKTWQEQLFLELNQFFEKNNNDSFTPFNLMGLMMSEGFFIQANHDLFN